MDAAVKLSTLVDVLQLSHDDAQFLLRKFNNDTERAIQEYFENPDVLKQTQPTRGWDEPPPYHNADVPSFRIDASDDVASNVRGTAPSRPPSRASLREDLIDLTAEHREAEKNINLSLQDRDREYRDVQAAIALSMGQPPPGQENGVTGTGQQFGPARGEYHDTKKWAMTVPNETTREIPNHPPPADRQRKAGEPAFLKPSNHPGSESLAALLTIYHSIPLAREALLLPSFQQFNYGYDSQWWTGRHVEEPRILSLDEDGLQSNRDDVLIETQRIMAFLDNTNRAYASIDALTDLRNYREKEAEPALARFLEAWVEGAMIRSGNDPLTQKFRSLGIKSEAGLRLDKYFVCLEPEVNPDLDQTFTDIFDKLIWMDYHMKQPLSDVWIQHISDIVTLRLYDPERKKGKLGVEIPAVWYPDRYMPDFKAVSRDMRARRRALELQRCELDRSRRHILKFMPTGRQGVLDIKKILSNAADKAPLLLARQPQQGDGINTVSSPPPSNEEVLDCVKALQNIILSIDRKVAELEHNREDLYNKIQVTTAELTQPNDDPSRSPVKKYTLRGVSTKPHITYVLRPAATASQTSEGPGTPGTEPSVSDQWQWWRLAFDNDEPKQKTSLVYGPIPRPPPIPEHSAATGANGPLSPWSSSNMHNKQSTADQNGNVITYSIRKVSEEEVLKAAREEDDSLTLVYASEKAVNFEGSALSRPLQFFVKADNRAFEHELRGIEESPTLTGMTNREEMAQLHFSSLHGMEDVALMEDSDETMNGEREGKEPTLAGLPAKREADGQPSPKRAKGEDEPPPYHETARTGPEMRERSGGVSLLGAVQPNQLGMNNENKTETAREDD